MRKKKTIFITVALFIIACGFLMAMARINAV